MFITSSRPHSWNTQNAYRTVSKFILHKTQKEDHIRKNATRTSQILPIATQLSLDNLESAISLIQSLIRRAVRDALTQKQRRRNYNYNFSTRFLATQNKGNLELLDARKTRTKTADVMKMFSIEQQLLLREKQQILAPHSLIAEILGFAKARSPAEISVAFRTTQDTITQLALALDATFTEQRMLFSSLKPALLIYQKEAGLSGILTDFFSFLKIVRPALTNLHRNRTIGKELIERELDLELKSRFISESAARNPASTKDVFSFRTMNEELNRLALSRNSSQPRTKKKKTEFDRHSQMTLTEIARYDPFLYRKLSCEIDSLYALLNKRDFSLYY